MLSLNDRAYLARSVPAKHRCCGKPVSHFLDCRVTSKYYNLLRTMLAHAPNSAPNFEALKRK